MDTKSKILFSFLGILIVLSVSASYYRYMVLHDYLVEAHVDCDPSLEICFVWECDPETEGECTGDEEEDTWYFKIAHRNAKNITSCDPQDEECQQFQCPEEGEEACDEVLCATDTLTEYALEGSCTNPEDFIESEIEEEFVAEEEIPFTNEDEGLYTEDAPVDDLETVDEDTKTETVP